MTTATALTPNGSFKNFMTIVGASTNYEAIDARDSDTTYIWGDQGDNSVVDLTTFTLPTGAVTKAINTVIVVKKESASSGSGPTTYVGIEIGGVGSTVLHTMPATGYSTSFTEYESGLQTIGSLTQTNIDNLRLGFTADSTTYNSYISYAYVEVQYVAIPVVTVTETLPDPYTSSNLVPIAWTNSLDSDGGSQTRYELKVFTDAQVAAGGFDPDTSTPYYTSGEVASGALTATTGPLATADTYSAYVRTAQTVNGVAHWSDWDDDVFTVNVTTANVDTVTTVSADGTGSIAVTVARDTTPDTAWDFIEVQRSIDDGDTWADVRGATYVDATGDTDSFVVTDYEVGNGVDVVYRARATRILSTLPITGEWVESTPDPDSWTSTSLFLKSPTDPTLNSSAIDLARHVQSSTSVTRGVYNVIGSAAPVVTSDVRQLTAGTLVFQTESTAEETAIQALSEEAVLLFQAPPTWRIDDMYISLGQITRERFVPVGVAVTRWTAEYVAVAAPADPLASAP